MSLKIGSKEKGILRAIGTHFLNTEQEIEGFIGFFGI